ncbi:MAG: hypothetical protein VW711_10815, partial [Verrucomicrobiales bacterium]
MRPDRAQPLLLGLQNVIRRSHAMLLACLCLQASWVSLTSAASSASPASLEEPISSSPFLMEEHGCFSCHEAGDTSQSPIPLQDWIPSLNRIHLRLQPAYLLNMILSPDEHSGDSRGSRMPHMLSSLPAEQQRSTAEAMTAYLWWAQDAPHGEEALSANEPSMEKGALLFQSLGCAACHPLSGGA